MRIRYSGLPTALSAMVGFGDLTTGVEKLF